MRSTANQTTLCILMLAILPFGSQAAAGLPNSRFSDDAWNTEQHRNLPDRTRRTNDAHAAAHLPGHALRASERLTILADAPRQTAHPHDTESSTTFTPQAFLLFGRSLYAGVGIGTTYRERQLDTNPFVGLRTGLSIDLFARWQIDISAQLQIRDSAHDLRAMSEDPDAGQLHIAGTLRWFF